MNDTKGITGLSADEASERLARHGTNSLPDAPRETVLNKLLQQFNNPLVFILLFALVIDTALWLHEDPASLPVEALAILLILVANACMGLWQNLKSEAALLKLKQMAAPQSWVYRDGRLQRIDSSQLVPGDIVRLKAGERIPADATAWQPEGFMVDESILTGESAPVDILAGKPLYSGTLAVRGFALVEITQTGASSNMGRLAAMLQDVKPEKTPLEKRLVVIGRKMAAAVITIASLLLVAGIAMAGTNYFSQSFLFAIALAVAAVPESLPAVITLALALGVERMAKRKAVVRKLSAVEALGSVTVIATDKTGTLTENSMEVQRVDTTDSAEARRAMILVNDADLATGAGDPLELGMLRHIAQQDPQLIHQTRQLFRKISSRPFDARWKYMRVTVSTPEGSTVSYLKGAPEVLLARSNLADTERQSWLGRLNDYAGMGYRALAVAMAEGECEESLRWLGLILLLDPPRPEIAESIRLAQGAGIRVLMITGDHPATAQEIGRQIGIVSNRVLTGPELDRMSDDEFESVVACADIYARITPEHKLKIVRTLQALNQVVAVTGDGVNDAPALKAADVGIAMGQRGSDVSREVADLILVDDNFATIIAAIEEGRSIYENIQKVIRFLFSTNLAEVLLITIGGLLAFHAVQDGAPLLLPLTAAQILWINLLTDSMPALAMITDKNPGVLLHRPRHVTAPLLDRNSLQCILVISMIGSLFSLAMLLWMPALAIAGDITQTVIFCYLAIVQMAFVNPARKSSYLPAYNPLVTAAIMTAVSIQVLAALLPQTRALLQMAPLSAEMAGLIGITVWISWLLAAGYSRLLYRHSHAGPG